MRRTQRQRYLNRVQSDVITWLSHRCVNCKDDVTKESWHRFRDSDWNGNRWVYLCYWCAPDRASALNYWQDKQEGL